VHRTVTVPRTALRSTFSHSPLVRLLGQWTPPPAEAPGADVAERLGAWVNAFDAIRLQGAHQAVANLRTARAGKPPARRGRARALAEDVQRVRSVLVQAIAQEPGPVVETALTPADLRRLARAAARPLEVAQAAEAASYAPWRQRHLELQRQMELMLPPLREHVRHAVSQAAPRLRQLAVLDAAMEQMLATREQKLLAGLAERMEHRFSELRAAHLQAVADSGEPDEPAAWRRPGGWLERFGRDWRQLLTAELDLRLQPVSGLVEALGKELNEQQ
jgi:hypothetical protein